MTATAHIVCNDTELTLSIIQDHFLSFRYELFKNENRTLHRMVPPTGIEPTTSWLIAHGIYHYATYT